MFDTLSGLQSKHVAIGAHCRHRVSYSTEGPSFQAARSRVVVTRSGFSTLSYFEAKFSTGTRP